MKYNIKYETIEVADKPTEYLTTPSKVFELIKQDFSPIQETMTVIGLNIKNGILYKKTVAMGSYNMVMCTPADLFRPLLIAGCCSFIVSHNHPSSDIEPSKEDITFTMKIQKASEYVGLSFLDHVIYTNDDYYSFKKNGII